VKRTFDVIAASIGVTILFPAMIFIALLVKATSRGPILFKQKRLTMDAREFTIFKFRTMFVDFDKDARGIQIKSSSNAITPLGRILRKTKLDEIPQLFNILLGDMSFVGPRPELPRRLHMYSDAARRIFTLRSGISSPASIVFSDEEFLLEKVSDPEKFYVEQIFPYKIDLNLYYIDHQSFWGDLKIVFLTFAKLIVKLGPELVVKDAELLAKKQILESEASRFANLS
jgi:lipopolysaccharide/colanic/teichoic acid biosynthesis glycosyltransferase